MIFLKLLFSCYRANFASRRIHIRLRVTRSKFYLAAAQFVDSKAFFLSPRCRSHLFAPKTTVGATLCGRPCLPWLTKCVAFLPSYRNKKPRTRRGFYGRSRLFALKRKASIAFGCIRRSAYGNNTLFPTLI